MKNECAEGTWVNKGIGSAFIAFVIYSSYFEKGRTSWSRNLEALYVHATIHLQNQTVPRTSLMNE